MGQVQDEERRVRYYKRRSEKAIGTRFGNVTLYHLNTREHWSSHASDSLSHRRMGHSSSHPVKNCEVCNSAKQTRKRFPKKKREQVDQSGLVCSDVMGPFEEPSNSGMKYVVTFILKKTRYVSVYPIRNKSVPSKFEEFYQIFSEDENSDQAIAKR